MSAIREVKTEAGMLRGVPGNNRMFTAVCPEYRSRQRREGL